MSNRPWGAERMMRQLTTSAWAGAAMRAVTWSDESTGATAPMTFPAAATRPTMDAATPRTSMSPASADEKLVFVSATRKTCAGGPHYVIFSSPQLLSHPSPERPALTLRFSFASRSVIAEEA